MQIAGGVGKVTFLLLFLMAINQSVTGQSSQLTPIGSTLANITNTDDANQNVSITGVFTGGIQFGATVYTSMYVSSNGYVTFGHGNSGYSPTGIPGYTLGPIIAAQYDDLHPGIAGDIYYSQNTDYVVVTYSGIAPYRSPTGVGSGYNTFQIVLRKATGYNGSSNLNFTIEIRYMDLQWAKSGNNSAWPTAGWSTGTGLVYSVLPYSGTSSFLLNESATNVGSSGLFNWAVEGGVVQSPPTVTTTSSVTSITGSSGISGGNVSADGGQSVTERGLVYATSQTPTISNSKVTSGAGTGTFTATMTGLNPGTTYYVRSYATNSLGTGYGPQVSFTTSSVSPPTVTTTAISSITTNTATSGYTVTSTGGATVTAQGIVWNTSGTPTTGSNTGTSSGSLTGLSNNTTYYVRAFATNSSGTSYGSQLSFLTFPTDPTSPAAAPSTICNGAGSQLSVSNGQGTVTWYTGSCGGTFAGVGNPLTVYPSVNTTYFAKNINTTGSSAGCVSVIVTVNQPASAPTGATASASGTGSANLSWAGSTGLAPITYSWAVGTSSGVTYESSYTSRGTTTDPTLTATATGLSQSTTYYMVVKASNSCATSAYNTSLSFRTHSILTYTAGTNGTISGSLSQTVANTTSGTEVTAVPNSGYNFVNWSDGSVVNPRTDANVTNSITVTANFAPNRLVFGTEPANKIAGANIPVTVRVTDTYGNTMASSAAAVTIAINDNPSIGGAGSLTGTLTVNAVSGVAVFTDLWINKTGTGYTLKASAASPITTTPVSNTFNITPAPIDHFTVAGITDPVVAGSTTSPVVTAYDQYLNIKTDYTGTITFTSTDPQSVLPASFTYAGGNNGVNTFSNGVTLKTTGEHTLTVTGNSKTGNQSTITVTPAAINHFILVANGTIVAGVPFTVTATVYDDYGNIKTNYSGSNNVLWTTTSATSGNGTARIMPANGIQTFTAGNATISGFTFFNSDQLPLPTITITDGPTASPGTTAPITVKNAILDNFRVVAGTTQAGGVPFSVTVTARDVYWNTAKDYVGNIRFKSSNDALVTFPAGLQPFTLANLGVRTFNTININMIGAYWLRAADAVFAFKSGDQQNILVGPGAFSPLTTKSTLIVDNTSKIAGEYVFVTIVPRDAIGNLLYSCRNISVYLDGSSSDYNGPILVTNVGDGSYIAQVRVTNTGAPNVISAKLDATGFDQTRTIIVAPATASHFAITGSGSQVAGEAQPIILTAYDEFDNIATGYTGSHSLTFSGASVSDAPSTSPTVAGTSFGTATPLSFTSGFASGTMSLYKVENASITATDGTINSDGHILPVTVVPSSANYLSVTGVSIQTAGESQLVTVTAFDAYNNVATGYAGSKSLTFTGANPALTLPASTNPRVGGNDFGSSTSLTFTSGTSTGTMYLYKTENAQVSVTDGTINSIDHKLSVGVVSSAANYFDITGSTTQVAGVAQTVTITAYDIFDNLATTYTGNKTLTFSGADLSPAPSTNPSFAGTAFGTGTTISFTSGTATGSLILYKAENALVTVSEGSINANSHKLSVAVDAAPENYFAVTGTGAQVAGTVQTITVTAYDAFNNPATAYSGSKSLTFSGANPSPAGSNSSINPKVSGIEIGTATTMAFVAGVSTGDMILYKTETAQISASEGSINADAHKLSVIVGHAQVSYFILNAPADITAGGSRAGYNVTRYDLFNNLVITGSQTVYLFSNSTGVNKKFYSAASAGSIITQLIIPNGVSLSNFWYYDENTGDHTITASESNPEDGITGIADGTDQITVKSALLKDFLVYGVSNPHNLGSWATVTVEARDIYNNRKTDYTGTLTFSNTDIDAINPIDYQFLQAEQGIHTFTDQLQFSNKGNWWLTAMDLNEPAKYGYQADIIVRKAVIITANNQSKVYGESLGTDPTLFDVSPASAEITGVTLTSTGAVSTAGVNTYSITPSLATGTVDYDPSFFNITYVDGTLTINKRDLVLGSFTADNKAYDGTTSVTGTGFTNDRISGDDLTFTYSAAFADKDAGTGKTVNYTEIVISGGASSDNYHLVSATGSTTADITPMDVVVTAYSGITKVYGSADPSVFDYTYSPLLLGTDVITGLLGRTAGEDAGNHTFAIGSLPAALTAGSNYSLTVSATPTFSITPASLIVTADDKSKCDDGSTFTDYTLSYSGFNNGDGPGSLILTSLIYGGTAISATDAGSYSIVPSGIISTNYTISYINGNLIIKPLPEPTIAGVSSVCEGTTGSVYTTETGMSVYSWTVSAGGTITSAGTPADNTITITWNTAGLQTVSVNYTNGNGCTANSATVFNVTVNSLTAGGTLTGGSSPIALGQSTGPIDLSSHTGSVVKWQKRLESGSWTDIANTSASYIATPNVVGTWEYRAVINNGTCSPANSSSVSIIVTSSDAGAVTGGITPLCSTNSTGTMTLADYNGVIVRWEKRVNGGSSWVDIGNAGSTTYSEIPSSDGLWEYRAVINNVSDLTSAPTEIEVVNSTVIKGSVAGGTTICSGSISGVLTLSGNTGTVAKWQSSVSPFSTWTDISNTSNTYISAPLTETTQFRAVVQNGICAVDYSDATTVTVNPPTVAGIVSGGTIICSGNTGELLTLTGNSGNVIKWQSTTAPFTNWTDIVNVSNTYTSDVLTQTTQFRAVVQNGICSQINSVSTEVTVNPVANGGSLSGRSTPIELGQSTGIITLSGYSGTVARWQKRLGAGSWTDVSNTSATYSTTPNVVGTWEYRAQIQSGTCTDVNSSSLSIQVLSSNAGAVTGGSTPICLNGSTGTMTLDGYTGTIVKWQKRVNQGSWSDIVNITATYTEIPSSEGTWEYRAIVNNLTDLTSAPTEIRVSPASNGGTISGSGSVCFGTNITLLTLSGYDGTVLKWQSSEDNWLNSFDINVTTSTYTAVNLTSSTQFRAVVSGICFQVNSGEAAINVDPISVGGTIAGTGTITYGNGTGTLTHSGQTGIVQKWQRKLNTGTWEDISSASNTYTEIPSAFGTWYYRAVVKSGSCSETNSSEVIVTVDKKELTVTGATVTSKAYDGNNSATITGAVLSGVVGSDDVTLENQTSGTFAQVDVGTGISVATVPMTITGAGVSNYILIQPVITGVINPITIEVTAEVKTKVYGETDPSLTYIFAPALITGDSFTGSLNRLAGENVGTYAINQSDLSLSANYFLSYTSADLTVTGKPIAVTADAQTKVYGDQDPSLTYTFTPALITGDSFSGSLTRAAGENTGTYAISQGTLALSTNYNLIPTNGVMTINKATLNVTADDKVKTYGDVNPVLTVTYTGFKGIDDKTVIDVPPAITTVAVRYSIPGTFSIVPALATDNNYLFNYTEGNLTINKAILTFRADDKTRDYLAANPALTFTISGLLNAETQSVLDALPSIQTVAVQNSNAGTYQITITGGSDNCYSFIYQTGTMTVSRISQTITFTDIPANMLVKDVYTIEASSTSGLTVLFESGNPQFATVTGNQLVGVSRGTAQIRGYNPGDQNYLSAEIFADVVIISTHKDILHLFTPNNDGFNDTWEIPDIASYGKCDVRIFNRWGKEVYANKNYNNLWDGTSSGIPLPDGAYYFIIKTDNSGTISGTVNIVR
jgi:gliding motility-associated-like protein